MRDEGIKMKNPAHPGGFIRAEVIEGRGLSIGEAAEALRVTRPAFSQMLNGHVALTSEMAMRLEKAFQLRMETLMRMQHNYELAQARARESEIDVVPYVPKAKPEPQPSML